MVSFKKGSLKHRLSHSVTLQTRTPGVGLMHASLAGMNDNHVFKAAGLAKKRRLFLEL